MSEQVSAVLDELAARFGETGAHLWAELVRWQLAQACIGIGVALALVFGAGIAWAVSYNRDPDSETTGVVGMMVAFAVVILAIVVCAIGPDLISPEGAVLRGLFR